SRARIPRNRGRRKKMKDESTSGECGAGAVESREKKVRGGAWQRCPMRLQRASSKKCGRRCTGSGSRSGELDAETRAGVDDASKVVSFRFSIQAVPGAAPAGRKNEAIERGKPGPAGSIRGRHLRTCLRPEK